jgi:hypothetical protein
MKIASCLAISGRIASHQNWAWARINVIDFQTRFPSALAG